MERRKILLGDGVVDTYIADLFLRFLNSLELWRVCDLAKTFPFILLKILLVVNLQDKTQSCQKQKEKIKTYKANNTNMTSYTVSMHFSVRVNKDNPTEKPRKCLFIDTLTEILSTYTD